MTGLAIALFFAKHSRAAIAIDQKSMYINARSIDGYDVYVFAEELCNLKQFAPSDRVGMRPSNLTDSIEIADRAARGEACGEFAEMATGGMTCNGNWCMVSDRITGAFRYAQTILAPLYAAGNYSRRPVSGFQAAYVASPRPLTIIWHIRNGDKKPHNDAGFFTRLKNSIARGLHGIPAWHYIVAQYPVRTGGRHGFDFILSLPDFNYTDLTALPLDDAMNHLIRADVLVHYGASSFSYSASLASPISQVKLYVEPKEVSWLHALHAHESFIVNGSIPVDEASGSVLPQYEAELATLLRARYDIVTRPK